jgi:hypothetical protein
VGAIVLVAVNPTELRREVGAAFQTDTGLTGCYLVVHHANTTPRFVGAIARLEGVAIGDVWNPISGAGSDRSDSHDSAA